MTLTVLDAADPAGRAAWLAAWEAWPEREPSAHPDYARLFARPGDRVVCALGAGPDGGILFPLIVRELAAEPWARAGETRRDATTPYGYGGPYAWGRRDDAAFWEAYRRWCASERIVTTFARLSLFPEQLAALPEPPRALLPNIVVPLAGGADALLKGYEGKVRKWVKTAEAAGLTVEADETGARLDDFVSIYTHTMTRNAAASWYFFKRDFFERLVAALPGRFVFFHTLKAGKTVSSDLMLLSRDHAYYFLGGTLDEAFDDGPNYLLKHRALSWASEKGLSSFVLGGGYEAGDGLFRYKRAYARSGEVPFRVAALTHDAAAAAELEQDRAAHEAKAGTQWAPKASYFPSYRG